MAVTPGVMFALVWLGLHTHDVHSHATGGWRKSVPFFLSLFEFLRLLRNPVKSVGLDDVSTSLVVFAVPGMK